MRAIHWTDLLVLPERGPEWRQHRLGIVIIRVIRVIRVIMVIMISTVANHPVKVVIRH